MNLLSDRYRPLALLAIVVVGLSAWYAVHRYRVAGARAAGAKAAGAKAIPEIVAVDRAAGQPVLVASAPLPPVAASRYQNTRPEASFVAAESCASCHEDEQASYLRTAHSRSLGDVDLAAEPPDDTFDHPPSARSYQIYRDGGQLRHRETVRLPAGDEIELADFPLRYVIGSGEHARSYLVETNGFLAESPVTWYAARRDWALSPGYEIFNAGFARPVVFACLFCHAGRVEPVGGNPNRLAIHTAAIDCQRCHGPGSLHVTRWTTSGGLGEAAAEAESGPKDDADVTIVNPRHLTRQQNEAICAQCHFHSDAEVDVRGRGIGDFRPGQSLSDFRVHFALQTTNKSMVVTGHGEQMHLSRCYQQSDSLTCTTCHDPHDRPDDEGKVGFYRHKCLACHDDQACGIAPGERRVKSPQDDCVACHMPHTSTEIRHIAATHHRIGIHQTLPATTARQPGLLVAMDDLADLPEIERERCLGVAYLNLAVQTSDPVASDSYRRKAQEILQRVRDQDLRDPVVDVALAKTYQAADPAKTIALAAGALQFEHVTAEMRIEALSALSNAYLRMRRTDQVIETLEQLVQLRRRGEDWFLLGVCRYQTGNIEGALEAARRAVAIRPDLPNFQGLLAELYQRNGQRELAAEHQRRAQQFSRLDGGGR